MTHIKFLFCIFLSLVNLTYCLDNGLGRTPPMGWLSWERFQCNTKCDKDPSNCISENLFMEMADRLVSEGYKDAGYEYINIDDCWMAQKRDENGDMIADPDRFPRGIKFLADYMHAKGLKLGIYQGIGSRTCMGFPGVKDHMLQDAKKFVEWDVDMLKLDGCYAKLGEMDQAYITMGKYLKSFGKAILYSCSWPYYQLISHLEPNYGLISTHCNLWRNAEDIHDSWQSIEAIIDFFGDNQEVITLFTGPGRWSDPDMLMIGNHHLTLGQSRIQMAVWSIIPGPLLMSNDLRNIKPEFKEILLNKKVIAINQDYLGIPGKRVYKENKLEVWQRKISPADSLDTSHALLFINKEKLKKSVIKFSLAEFGLSNRNYIITELFNNKSFGILKGNETVRLIVPPMDAILLSCKILT